MNDDKKQMCEDATGIRQKNVLTFFSNKGGVISIEKAKKLVEKGKFVEIPSAGAGNYEEIFDALGFTIHEVIDSTSSAGDWFFAIKQGNFWKVAWQHNRYPRFGFRYGVSKRNYLCLREIYDKV